MAVKKDLKSAKKNTGKNAKKISKVLGKKSKIVKSTKGVKYILDCTKPVKDTILDISGLVI